LLWLLRHADAADGSPDDARPLTERGVRQAQAAGRALVGLGAELDVCFTSPKRRAVETAELVCESLGVEVITTNELSGSPFDAERIAEGYGGAMLVGHDPSISLCLHDLTGVQARMAKGGLAAVAKGELLVLLRPREIALIAAAQETVA
jgi:phosphohistidine phosphatase